MNYTMGRYIDGLDDEARDRLLTAKDFSTGGWWSAEDECGCLITTAIGARGARGAEEHVREVFGRVYGFVSRWAAYPPHLRYPYAVNRFGKDRVVRAIKLRAAAAMSSEVAGDGEGDHGGGSSAPSDGVITRESAGSVPAMVAS